MQKTHHVQPYWGKPGPKAIPHISDLRTARQWLKACDRNGWTPLNDREMGKIKAIVNLLNEYGAGL